MSASLNTMLMVAGLFAKRKKRSTSKSPSMDTLKEEASHTNRKPPREGEPVWKKRFYLNATYKQFLKYLKLLKISEDELKEEVNKDQDELEKKYALYLAESDPEEEDAVGDAASLPTASTSTEYVVDSGMTGNALTECRSISKKNNGSNYEARSGRIAELKMRAEKSFHGTSTMRRSFPLQSKLNSPLPPLCTVSPPARPFGPRKENTDCTSISKLGRSEINLPLMKSKTDLIEPFLSDSRAMLAKSRSGLSNAGSTDFQGDGNFLTTSATESRPKGRQTSRHSSRPTSRRRRGSVQDVVDWEKRKLSLQRWSTSDWIVVRDTKYSKEVERLRAMEMDKKIGDRLRKQDVPITCQRWKYESLEGSSPIRFGVTYSGEKAKKRKSVYKRIPPGPQRMVNR